MTEKAAVSALYLAFRASGERYAIPVDRVREVARPRRIAPLPGTSPEYAGVTLVRGEPLGVVDVGKSLTGSPSGKQQAAPGQERALIVLEGQPRALLVDRIDGVRGIDAESIVPVPASRRLLGVVAEGSRFLSILDLDAFFGDVAS